MITQNAPGYMTIAATGHDTLGYSEHVVAHNVRRYAEIEPNGYLHGSHDHVAAFYARAVRRGY